jgi:hypothetical protein
VNPLVLERREQSNLSPAVQSGNTTILMTPPISEDYWAYRVRVADGQAVVGFPKFNVIGIGFAAEEDWNTNLPSSEDAERIRQHIWHNRGPNIEDTIQQAGRVVAAIEMIQDAVREDSA